MLCNGIGGRLELFQPFVDALDPRRGVIRFDMPGIGESPAPVVPYHLATLAPLLTGLLDQLGVALSAGNQPGPFPAVRRGHANQGLAHDLLAWPAEPVPARDAAVCLI